MPDEDLVEAIGSIPDADVDSITQYTSGAGSFVINRGAEDLDDEEIGEVLEDAGYERSGGLEIPGMVQQNFRPAEEGGDE